MKAFVLRTNGSSPARGATGRTHRRQSARTRSCRSATIVLDVDPAWARRPVSVPRCAASAQQRYGVGQMDIKTLDPGVGGAALEGVRTRAAPATAFGVRTCRPEAWMSPSHKNCMRLTTPESRALPRAHVCGRHNCSADGTIERFSYRIAVGRRSGAARGARHPDHEDPVYCETQYPRVIGNTYTDVSFIREREL